VAGILERKFEHTPLQHTAYASGGGMAPFRLRTGGSVADAKVIFSHGISFCRTIGRGPTGIHSDDSSVRSQDRGLGGKRIEDQLVKLGEFPSLDLTGGQILLDRLQQGSASFSIEHRIHLCADEGAKVRFGCHEARYCCFFPSSKLFRVSSRSRVMLHATRSVERVPRAIA
jgi:hypothetical protein